jgi:CBS domain-containing protein
MFSVYGRAGRLFQGSMEDLRKVSAMSALSRSRRIAPVGQGTPGDAPAGPAMHSEPKDVVHRSAVAAYAQTAKPETNRHPLTLVEHIWTQNVITIADTATVGDAWHLLAERGLGQTPVVSADGLLVGLVTRADLTRADRLPGAEMHLLVWRALLAQSVVDVMWTPVPSVSLDTDIRRVARVLLDTGLPGLPVVQDSGVVIGFVSRTDILRAVVADPPLDLWT